MNFVQVLNDQSVYKYNPEFVYSSDVNQNAAYQFDDESLRNTEFDYSEVIPFNERSAGPRPSDSDDLLGLKNVRTFSRNSSQQTLPSLVDVVREKNFQTQLNWSSASMGTSTSATLSTNHNDLLTTGIAKLEVNDLDSWGATAIAHQHSAKIPQMTILSNRNKNEYSPSSFVGPENCSRRISVQDKDNSAKTRCNTDTGTSSFNEVVDTPSTVRSNGLSRNQCSSFLGDCASSMSVNNSLDSENVNLYPPSLNANVSSYDNSASSFLSQVNDQIKVINCISRMSKEQLSHVMKMIQDVHSPVMKEMDRSDTQSPVTFQKMKARSLWNAGELSQNGHQGAQSAQSQRSRILRLADENNDTLDVEARKHHIAAECGDVEPTYIWSGELPKRSYEAPLSTKVFIGGLPYQTTEDILISTFSPFGNFIIEWPGKEGKAQPKGYVYVTFESEFQVKLLLKSCREYEGNLYYKIRLRKSKLKEVEVIPWSITDSNYVPAGIFLKLDPRKTVFVGAIHGKMSAEGLFRIMNDLFEGVIFVGICVDKRKYPTGSARVSFNNNESYMKAVTAGFVNLKTKKFSKTIQIDPFLADTGCSVCQMQNGPYFCRKSSCFRYFCEECWKSYHQMLLFPGSHKPLRKNPKLGSSTLTSMFSGLPSFIYSL